MQCCVCVCACVCVLGAGKGAERSDASKIVKVTGAVSGTAKKGQAHSVNIDVDLCTYSY